MQYKVIFLDWYRTLSDSLFWGNWQNDTDHSEDLQSILSVMFANDSQFVNDWMRGKFNSEQAVERICEATKLNKETVFQELVSSSKDMKLNDVGTLEIISELRKQGVKVVIATDNMDTFMRWTVPSMQLDKHFDGFIDSYAQKALKADFDGNSSLFFRQYLSNSEVSPSDMVLIDDREDAVIVERAGINFYHFDRSKSLKNVLEELLNESK